jgi:hypothetical protein
LEVSTMLQIIGVALLSTVIVLGLTIPLVSFIRGW